MDARVDERKHPDGRGHVADTRPHAQHGTSVVVRLQSRASLALENDDERVNDLVEFGEVEDPAPESKALVPDAPEIIRLRETIGVQLDVWVRALPLMSVRVVGDGIAQSARPMHLAEGINGSDESVRFGVMGNGMLERADHGPAGDGRVYGQQDIVEDDKGEEGASLADPPGLIPMLPVVGVEEGDCGRVYGSHRQRDDGLQHGVVDVGGNGERVPEAGEGSLGDRRGYGRRRGVGGEFEDGPLGEFAWVEARSSARHGGRTTVVLGC